MLDQQAERAGVARQVAAPDRWMRTSGPAPARHSGACRERLLLARPLLVLNRAIGRISMGDIIEVVIGIVGEQHVSVGDAIREDQTHDECLTVDGVVPLAVVCPADTSEVARVLRACDEQHVGVTARGRRQDCPEDALLRPTGSSCRSSGWTPSSR